MPRRTYPVHLAHNLAFDDATTAVGVRVRVRDMTMQQQRGTIASEIHKQARTTNGTPTIRRPVTITMSA